VLDVVLIEFSLDQSHGEHSLNGGKLHVILSIIKLLPLRVSSMRSNLCLDYVKVLFSFGANSLGLLDALGDVTHVDLRFKGLLDALRQVGRLTILCLVCCAVATHLLCLE